MECEKCEKLLLALHNIASMKNLPIGSQSEEMSSRLEAAAIASAAIGQYNQ